MDLPPRRVVLVVPRQRVKTVKSALERSGKLDRTVKIIPVIQDQANGHTESELLDSKGNGEVLDKVLRDPLQRSIVIHEHPTSASENPVTISQQSATTNSKKLQTTPMEHEVKVGGCMRIPTTIPYPPSEDCRNQKVQDAENNLLKLKVVKELCISELVDDISMSHHTIWNTEMTAAERNPLRRALKEALDNLPEPILTTLGFTSSVLVDAFSEGYSVYKPMLLLPHNAFTFPPWQKLLSTHSLNSFVFNRVWKHIATAMNTSHIAINSPIPLQTSTHSMTATDSQPKDNIIRSPVNLKPIYGDFGPIPTPRTLSAPISSDFDTALWVTATQNNIHQTWAPQYTMFSRGNMREKTRLLHLPLDISLTIPFAALDLYAGIGYFAFSYRRAGLRPVICFELNPWSVEGLRRGAALNGWTVTVYENEDTTGAEVGMDADFLVFQMSNTYTLRILTHLPDPKPSIRHINLGLLPTSRDSWRDAAALVQREEGGWVHVHENVGSGEIEDRRTEIEMAFKSYVEEGLERDIRVEWVERVKMYAPGVVHCVFDVWIGRPRGQ